jgi:hypothetical protein
MSKEAIKCTNDNLVKIVKEQIELLGNEANLNHLDISEVTSHWAMKKAILDTGFNGDILEWYGYADTKVLKTIRRLYLKQNEQIKRENEKIKRENDQIKREAVIEIIVSLIPHPLESRQMYFVKTPEHLRIYKELVKKAHIFQQLNGIVDPIDFGTDPLGMKDFTIT